MVNEDDLKNISKDLKRYIIKQHMKRYYYSTVAFGSFIIGMLVGILIKQGLAPVAKLVKAPNS